MAKRITINQLAQMVARGFEDLRREMLEGFASLRAVLDDHTQALAGHTQTLAEHTQTLADHTRTLADHTQTLAGHSHRLDRIERKLDSTIDRSDAHDVRISALEKRTGRRR